MRGAHTEPTATAATSKVLLVDDSDDLRQATRELLEDMGHEVATASDAEEALRIFDAGRDRRFDVLVSDVFMPGAGGLELTEAVLARDGGLAVLLISSRGGEPELRRRLEEGDVAFLAKPFSPEELAAAVAEAKRRVARRLAARRSGASRSAPSPPAVRERRDRGGRAQVWKLAAAVVTVLGLGVLLRGFGLGAPPLPAPVPDGVRRSAVIAPLAPLGAVAEVPAALSWQPVPAGDAYAVSLRGVDGGELWRARVEGPRAPLPQDVAAGLRRAVTYYWSVEALDAAGGRLASSGPVRFSIELAPRRQTSSDRPEDEEP